MVGGSLQSNTNIKLPLAFILYALAAFVVAQIVLLINSDLLTMGQFRIPDIWMGAHFLLLGYAVMIAMGAMYQLVPVALLTPIWNQTFGFIQLIVTAVGITAFSILLGLAPNKALYGGMIAVIGVLMFIIQMVKTINKQEQKNMMTAFILGAIIFLSLTIVAGFLLAWNLSIGGIASHGSILSSHITFGVAGWFSLLIFGFSYKLVPMFSLSHGYSMKWAKPAFFTYMTGLVILIASFWAKVATLETIGWIGMLGGFFFFVLDIREILTKRMKKKLDKPFSFSLVAIMNGLGVHVLAFAFSVFGIHNITVWGWLIFLYVMGWIVFSILGYLYKIVPFLWWTYKYANKIGQEKVPTLKEMIDEKTSVILFTLFIISTAGLTVSGLLQINITVFLFQGLLTLTSLLYVLSIIRVLTK
ncbi:hypothetical protein [Lentibacillus cibarius]|uniref:Cbb3-type cytochrome c oxidase subunit I n=1 Tax=Lentibacillus cibarius TaxID=2583219 RepID=A0A5S3QMR2_9BACI|nr:hypothetical protein [Lentibacillus cibarius]TMN23095.1 hypothetical protein FFL34_14105 [Lentibacillus cibarius]